MAAQESPLWNHHRDSPSAEALEYFGFEATATILRSYESQLIHGLLQAEEYSRAVLSQVYELPAENVDRLVESRRERQAQLSDLGDRQLYFVIDEAVLRRSVGGLDVMTAQLEHLVEVASMPGVTVQIVPFAAGANLGMRGPFTYLEFGGDTRDALYLETARYDTVAAADSADIEPFLRAFTDLQAIATRPAELASFIEGLSSRS